MKNMIVIAKTILFVLFISVFLVIWWIFYNNFLVGSNSRASQRLDRPSMPEVVLLLDEVTKGLPPADRNDEYSKDVVRSLFRKYDNPTQSIFNKVMNNVSNQKKWVESDLKEYSKYEYCYNQYQLIVSEEKNDYSVIGKGVIHYLSVSVSWTDSSHCRKSYLERLNSKVS